MATAHELLGEEVSYQAAVILRANLDRIDFETFLHELLYIRSCRCAIESQMTNNQLDGKIRQALSEYVDCLNGWARGAQLSTFHHKHVDHAREQGESVGAVELALLLQNDSAGCQSGACRGADGSTYLWHTEEDVDKQGQARFDKLRLASFSVQNGRRRAQLFSFIYPDLMPGPAFNWRSDGFVQLVDSLHVKHNHDGCRLLANIVTWISLRLGNQVSLAEIVASLAPYIDGYAILAAYQKDGRIHVEKVEFADDQIISTGLGRSEGDALLQVNVVSHKDSALARMVEELSPAARSMYEKRLQRTEKAIKGFSPSGDWPAFLRGLLASRTGGEDAYANLIVKAYFLAEMNTAALNLWAGNGPALPDDIPLQFRFVTHSPSITA